MDKQTIVTELRSIIGDYLKDQGLDLVDLIYRYEGRDLVLRVLVDKPQGGINLDECAHLNNEIGRILDEKDVLKERYILEVFSPGLDRPLKTKSDFLRYVNRSARFFLCEFINGKVELEGIIKKMEGDSVYVDVEGQIVEIPLNRINKAKQIIK